MGNSQLIGSSFIDGLRAPHYVDGRLLTAEDLEAEQQATLTRLGWLGQALGPGVVAGLTVSGQGAELRVEPGIGLTPAGQSFRLPTPTALALSLTAPAAEAADAGRFQTCGLDTAVGVAGIAGGAYLLAVTPASRLEGAAPLKGSPAAGAAPGCAARWEVDGLQFKAIRLTGFSLAGFSLSGDETTRRRQVSRLRSRLAHWCLGSAKLHTLPRDPFDFPERYAGIDAIAAEDLTPGDLPLAVFHWTGSALTFVDQWAARRRPARPAALDGWHATLADRRDAEGQARFLQFQAQLAAIQQPGVNADVEATDYFDWLPPAGLVPIAVQGVQALTALYSFLDNLPFLQQLAAVAARLAQLHPGNSNFLVDALTARFAAEGFLLESFFTGIATREAAGSDNPDGEESLRFGLLCGDSLDTLLNGSWLDEAVDLSEAPAFDVLLVADQLTDALAEALYALAGADDAALKLLATLGAAAAGAARAADAHAPTMALARSLARAARAAQERTITSISTAGAVRVNTGFTTANRFSRVRLASFGGVISGAGDIQLYAMFVKRIPPPFYESSQLNRGPDG